VALRDPASDAGQPYEAPDEVPIARRSEAGSSARGILVVGVDKLLTVLAKCCKPAPPDPIVGFVSRGRGVTVHRRDCPNVSRMPQERMIESGWGRPDGERFAVDLEVLAHDRQGLLRDISELLSREKVNVTATQTSSRSDTAPNRPITTGRPRAARISALSPPSQNAAKVSAGRKTIISGRRRTVPIRTKTRPAGNAKTLMLRFPSATNQRAG
jgi:hypothetical protein